MRCRTMARNWADLLLLTLYMAGGRIRGRTRLQKLAFLVWKRLQEHRDRLPPELRKLACLEFRPANYGPYAPELAKDAIEYMVEHGLVEISRPLNRPEEYMLTDKGAEAGRSLYTRLEILGIAPDGTIRKLNEASLAELVQLVYDAYPEYTIKSRIKEQLSSGAVVAWSYLEEGDIELIRDMIREDHIKMHPPVYLDPKEEKEFSLAGGRLKVRLHFWGTRPKLTVSLYPKDRKEDNSRG